MTHEIACDDCRLLLGLYEQALSHYRAAADQLTGLLGDDYKLALDKANVLHIACQEKHAAFLSHWRIHHSFAPTPS